MMIKATVMDKDAIARSVTRMAHQIVDGCRDIANLRIVGIRTRGIPLAKRISDSVAGFTGISVPAGTLDITLYRDDLTETGNVPAVDISDMGFDPTGRDIVLVDDVLYTGRTARAALDALLSRGRASSVRLAVLVDRGHRELPIRADYVGKNIPTSPEETVVVRFSETDGEDIVLLMDTVNQTSVFNT